MASARYSFERENKQFVDYRLARLPNRWRADVERLYHEKTQSEGIRAANDWLRVLIEPLENLLNIAACDDDLKKLADELAKKCADFAGMLGRDDIKCVSHNAFEFYGVLCASYAVKMPDWYHLDNMQVLARLIDATWWLRSLRVAHAKAREVAAINAGLVHRKAALYCSDDTLERRGEQIARNAALMNEITLQSESGEQMKLADVAKSGMANAENRRAELMTRITGFEQLAIKYGHKAEFITVTCPSRMHAVLSSGGNNPKYDGTKPDEAQAYLVKQWARLRAAAAKVGVRFYGLRVCEPHHDATPHWHIILFMQEKTIRPLRALFYRYFLRNDSARESGAVKNRVKFVSINPRRGSAAGYVVKYVCKNLGGVADDLSDEGNLSSESAAVRVEAWASTWRIRQFQQVGGHSVSVWREFRRIDKDLIPFGLDDLMQAWRAAQKIQDKKANYADFVEAMGGLHTPPRESRFSLDDDYIYKTGKYGETVARIVKGIRQRFGLVAIKNNRESWDRVNNEMSEGSKEYKKLMDFVKCGANIELAKKAGVL